MSVCVCACVCVCSGVSLASVVATANSPPSSPDAAVLRSSSGEGQSDVAVCLWREGKNTDTSTFTASESIGVLVKVWGVRGRVGCVWGSV